jgi:hypothetical protein
MWALARVEAGLRRSSSMTGMLWRHAGAVAAAATLAGLASAMATAADAPKITVELNKLEPLEKACRVYLMVGNATDAGYSALKLDLVLFQPDGVIGKRVVVDLAPVKPQKRSLRLFDLDGMGCDRIASVLVNDVTDCKGDAGPLDNCVAGLALSSLSNVKFSK